MITITAEQIHILRLRKTDIESVLLRFNENQETYEACLRAFLADKTVEQLNTFLKSNMWDDAFTAAHALKGLAGNMGFIPLMHSTAQLIVLIRSGRTKEVPLSLESVNSSYRDIIDAIHQYFSVSDDIKKEIYNED